jgi:hypothetical protein
MKDLKDQLITEDNLTEQYKKYVDFDKVMYSIVIVTKDSAVEGCLFRNLKQIRTLYEDWAGFEDDEIDSLCHDIDHLKKNESLVHISSKDEYEIITALK